MFTNPFDKTPRWIKELADNDENKALLLRILEYTREPIEKPKKVLFAIRRFKDRDSAEAAIHDYLDKEGWHSRTRYNETTREFIVESEKVDYVFSKESLLHDESMFGRVAGLYNAEYDGWTVVLPPK